jgi:hypothetical protein
MDPYLESPDHWPDFHDRFAAETSAVLNKILPHPYFAQLAVREQIGLFVDGLEGRIVPDVAVTRSIKGPSSAGSQAVAPQQRSGGSAESVLFELDFDVEEVNYVEIRDGSGSSEAVTIIEILSPSNKAAGADRDQYVEKRNKILCSSTSLVEIDLLRKGSRLWAGFQVDARLRGMSPPPDYVALINRAWTRPAKLAYEIFPISLSSPLPTIPVPLRDGTAEPLLDLQQVFDETYGRGPYARSVDYSAEAFPPLSAAQQEWAKRLTSK